MALVIRNTTIVTSDAARTVHHDASIVVDADRIVAIGPAAEVDRAWPGAERVEGRGKAVFPGLVNCHTCSGLEKRVRSTPTPLSRFGRRTDPAGTEAPYPPWSNRPG